VVYFEFPPDINGANNRLILQSSTGQVLEMFNPQVSEQQLEWNAQRLPSGMYFYQWRNNKGLVKSGKFVLQR